MRDGIAVSGTMLLRLFIVALTIFVGGAAGAARAERMLPYAGRHELQLQRPEGSRTYTAVIPENAPRTKAALVIALHGLGGSGAVIIDQGRWEEAARRHGFI
ncbi:MAG: hypothetical protein K2Q06_06285, partial [Parvularculaceae bacterium]|nr:hypothetical protein [Parvularculaceae bacterium]